MALRVTGVPPTKVSGLLQKKILSLSRADLLIIDELGYLDLSKKVTSLFFQLFSKRYENCSTIIISNKPFDEWGAIFYDDAVALLFLTDCCIILIPSSSKGKAIDYKKTNDFGWVTFFDKSGSKFLKIYIPSNCAETHIEKE
jgi:DNA replication protein DnaC